MLRSAARREAISPGFKVGLRSKSCIEMVGCAAIGMALCSFGLLKKPMLLRSRSWVKRMCFGVFEGTLSCGSGSGT